MVWEENQQDSYYPLGVHAPLVSLAEPEAKDGNTCQGGMELRNRDGDLFADVERVNNVYPMVLRVLPPKAGLAAWTQAGEVQT